MARTTAGTEPASIRRDDNRTDTVAAKAFARIAGFWRLSNDEAAALMGVSSRTWSRVRSGTWQGRLSQDQLLRLSALTGLYKALHLYFSDQLADAWPRLPNAGEAFRGRTPVETMIDGGLPAIMGTRDLVDALRGGA